MVSKCVQLLSAFSLSLFCWTVSVWAASPFMMINPPVHLSFTGFASSLAVIGDVDGDQVPDYLVGAYQHRWQGNDKQGRAFVYSGRGGRLLYALDSPRPQPDAAFGFALGSAGDVDRDGVPDLLVGAFGQGEKGSAWDLVQREKERRGDAIETEQYTAGGGWRLIEKEQARRGKAMAMEKNVGSGQGFVFSGKDGHFLYPLQAPQQQKGAGFGWAVASCGDLNGDGIPEQLVGALAQDGLGKVYIFSGKDGAHLRTLSPPVWAGRMAFGWSLAGSPDLNADGVADILVGAPYTTVGEATVEGRVYAFSGSDGTVLFAIDDPQPSAGAVFGWHVATSGDLNADGIADILVGAPYKDVGPSPSEGVAFAFSGADGALLLSLHNPGLTTPYATFGYVVTGVPDVNRDGTPEILVGAPYQTVDEYHLQGEVFLFNGRDGRHLATFDNPHPHQGSSFGYVLASPGDVDGDRLPDFAIGAAGQSIRNKVAVGRVYIFLSGTGEDTTDTRIRLRQGDR